MYWWKKETFESHRSFVGNESAFEKEEKLADFCVPFWAGSNEER
jgi:hypothetical protein